MFHLVSYWWFQEDPIYNINQFVLQELGNCGRVSDCEELVGVIHRTVVKDFTWMVSDCEELVGGNRPRSTNWYMTIQYYNINYNQAPKNTNWPGLP